MSCHLWPTICSWTQLKWNCYIAVIRLTHCLIKQSSHRTGSDSHTLAPAIHPSPRMKLTCFDGDCMTVTTVGFVTNNDLMSSFRMFTVIVPIISCLLFNSCSDRCDLNRSPALFYPSSLVLNGRNTVFVENCKINRYWITTEANVFIHQHCISEFWCLSTFLQAQGELPDLQPPDC